MLEIELVFLELTEMRNLKRGNGTGPTSLFVELKRFAIGWL